MPKVAVFVGSLRQQSVNRAFAQALAKLAAPKLDFVFSELGDIPHFNQDQEKAPPPAVQPAPCAHTWSTTTYALARGLAASG